MENKKRRDKMKKYILIGLMLLMTGVCHADKTFERGILKTLPSDLEGDLASYHYEISSNTSREKGVQVDFQNFSIATSNTVTTKFENILGWDGFDFFVSAVSSGSITTANLISYQADWTTILSQQAMTSGTRRTSDSNFIAIVITNQVAIPITATMSIIAYDD